MTDQQTLEALGITREEVVDRLVGRLLDGGGIHEYVASDLERRMRELLDEAVEKIAEKDLLPVVVKFAEESVLQPTNRWGEPRGDPQTFTEYLVGAAKKFIEEPVNYKGDKADAYSKGTQTRITHMVHEHLHYSIENAIKRAMKEAETNLGKSIVETVKLKLAELSKAIKVEVKS